MAGLTVEPRLESFGMESLFGETLPTLPYNSFTGLPNVFFHEGVQGSAPVASTSLDDSGSVDLSSGSPTTVMTALPDHEGSKAAGSKGTGGRKAASKAKDQDQLERIRAKNRRSVALLSVWVVVIFVEGEACACVYGKGKVVYQEKVYPDAAGQAGII